MTVGERIRKARKDAGLTQNQLAARLSISYVNISQLERGDRNPGVETLQRIADALDIPVGELLGTVRFLTTTMGVSLADLVGDRDNGVQYSYQGEERPLEDIVAEITPRRVFLLLGLNDLASDTDPVIADIVDRYVRLIDNLQTACPGAECIIITNPPKVASQWLPDYTANRHFGNALIGEFVDALTQMCRENNIPYVDAYECLKNENGALPDDYCRDGYIHLNHQGAAVVVEALEAFAEGR